MFVRVEPVLVISIFLTTCLTGTSQLEISPNHIHSAPDKPVTFTCTADEAVSACEFLVRYNDVDLAVVNPAQAQYGSFELASSGDQSQALNAPSRGRETNGPAQTTPRNQFNVAGQRDVADETAASAPVSRPKTTGSDGRTQGLSGPPLETGRTEPDTTVAEENNPEDENVQSQHQEPTGSPSRRQKTVGAGSRNKSVSDGSIAQDGINGGTPSTSPRPGPPRTPPGFNEKPTWIRTTKRPSTTGQRLAESGIDVRSDEPASGHSWSFRNRSKSHVIQAKDVARVSVVPVKVKPMSPYPANDVQCVRRKHGLKYKYPAPKRTSTSQNNLRQRMGDDGYRWRANADGNVCTLTLPEVKEGLHLIGCRARKAVGGWEYVTASMDVNRFQPLGLTAQTSPLVRPGNRLNLSFKSTQPMTSCFVNRNTGSLTSRQDCRLTIPAVPGPVWFTGLSGRTRKESRATFLSVSSVPARIDFGVVKTKLMEGEFFTATCAVGVQQPPANMSWYLGDELLRADAEDDFADSKWVWPWEGRGLRQSLSMTLTTDDDNLPLICQVDHKYLTEPLKKNVTMHVTPDVDDGTEDCGIVTDLSTRLMGAKKATAHVPWVAAIYRRMRSGDYEHVCGGTLVSRRLVVSSAQCFWDATFSRVADPSLFRVALGSSGREWKPSDVRVQSPGVVRVAVPKHFIGRSANFAYDIAVLVLDSAVTLSDNVLPACVDRADTLPELQATDVGSVSGWGITESGRTSPVLRSIDLPYVDLDECFRAVDSELHRFISYDKFCAGYRNQAKSVCPGDSGGGLVFQDEASGRHYLRGVASVGFAPIGNDEYCFADLYTGFTLVSEYATWIFKQAPQPPVAA